MSDSLSADSSGVFGALALELAPGSLADRLALDQDAASELAGLIAADLAQHAPRVTALDLAVVAAHFDPVELLRPRWPVHAGLVELAARAPKPDISALARPHPDLPRSSEPGPSMAPPRVPPHAGEGAKGQIVAFGARDGALPAALSPDANHVGGPLRLVPFALRGEAALLAEVAGVLEATLMETGMAGAATALAAQDGFGARFEHARYLTLHDLLALTAMQYGHANLGPLWPLIEAALLMPGREAWLDAPPEPLARQIDGEVRIALLDLDVWADTGFAPKDTAAARLTRAYERFEMRQRQFAAVLRAHNIPVVFDHCPTGKDPRALLR